MAMALILALETGQRQADLLVLGWSNVADGKIVLKQQKTGILVAAPISETLQYYLARARRGPRRPS
jgi:integrase